jgi:hypothetical protein
MNASPQHIDERVLQFMHSTPVFNFEQQHRYQGLLTISSEIQSIAGHFTAYADLGQKMCSEFAALRKSFGRMEVMSADASIRPLGKVFKSVGRAFSSHFNEVTHKIVGELNAFVKKEFEELNLFAREHERLLREFNCAEEEYTTLKVQVSTAKKEKIEHTLKQSHTCSTLAFFDFCHKMEGIELKLRSIVPRTFLAFLASVTGPFRDCLNAINEKEDLLNSAQTSVQEVDQSIVEFSQRSAEAKQALSSQIPIFWNRLTEPFSKTSAISIHGYLWRKPSGTLSRSWHKRFFMVSNGVLSWAKTIDQALRSEKNLRLLFCSVRPEPNAVRSNCFSLTPANAHPLILQALTPWDMEEWLAVIQNSISMQLNYEDDIGRTSAIVTSAVCADCRARNASWSAINWAVPICEACAGEHRALGVGVSRVRSFTLDELDPMLHALVEAIGPNHGNSVLEQLLPSEERLPEDAKPPDRYRFLIRKYRDREWVAPADDIDIFKAVQEQVILDVYKYIAKGNAIQVERFSGIHAAAIVGNPLIMHLLCLNAGRVDGLDEHGWTPLCYAVYYGQSQMADILIGYGAEQSPEGVSPYEIAKMKGDEEMMAKVATFAGIGIPVEAGFEVPHGEVQPAEFKLENFVEDAAFYARMYEAKPEISPGDQMKLNSVVSALRQKLMGRHNGPAVADESTGRDLNS